MTNKKPDIINDVLKPSIPSKNSPAVDVVVVIGLMLDSLTWMGLGGLLSELSHT